MIDSYFRQRYQKLIITPLLHKNSPIIKMSPSTITFLSCLTGCLIPLFLWKHQPAIAISLLVFSGFLDTLDGSLARVQKTDSPSGATLDIFSDRIVELSIIIGLYLYDPSLRASLTLFILGSNYLCVTSFLIVSMFSVNDSKKSFFYSPGLIERGEAFIFFGLMMLFPNGFMLFSVVYIVLVTLTALIRITEFLVSQKKASQPNEK